MEKNREMQPGKKTPIKELGETTAKLGQRIAGIVKNKRFWGIVLALLLLLAFAATRDELPGATPKPAQPKAQPFSPNVTATALMADAAWEGATYDDFDMVMDFEEAEVDASDDAGVAQKIIRTASLTLVTRAFEDDLAAVRALCDAAGGYVSYSRQTEDNKGLRSGQLTLQIPSDRLDDFLAGAAGVGRLTRREENAEDVTESYRDQQTRLATQRALMERLQSLAATAGSLTELLELERQIADTQYQIDRLEGSLKSTDRRVEYAQVSLTLKEEREQEVASEQRVPLLQRIGAALMLGVGGLGSFVADALVFLAAILPVAFVLAAFVFGIRCIRRRRQGR